MAGRVDRPEKTYGGENGVKAARALPDLINAAAPRFVSGTFAGMSDRARIRTQKKPVPRDRPKVLWRRKMLFKTALALLTMSNG